MKKFTFTLLLTLTMVGTTMSAPGPYYTMDMHRYGLTNASRIQGTTGQFQYLEVDTNLLRGTVLFARTGHYEVVYIGTNAAYESNMWRVISWTEASNLFLLRSGDTLNNDKELHFLSPVINQTLALSAGSSGSGWGLYCSNYYSSATFLYCDKVAPFDWVTTNRINVAEPLIPGHAATKSYVDSKILSSVTNGTGTTQSPYFMPSTDWVYWIKYVVENGKITNGQIGITFSGGQTNTAGSFDKFTLAYFSHTNGFGFQGGLGVYDNESQKGLGELLVGPCTRTNGAANKGYVDNTFVKKSGDTMIGTLSVTNNIGYIEAFHNVKSVDVDAGMAYNTRLRIGSASESIGTSTVAFVHDAIDSAFMQFINTGSGVASLGIYSNETGVGYYRLRVANPSHVNDATTKSYVDYRTNIFSASPVAAGAWNGQIWVSNGYAWYWNGGVWQ